MVAFNREHQYPIVTPDDDKEWSDEFDSSQHIRDLAYWAGLSLCIGIFIGMAIMAWFCGANP